MVQFIIMGHEDFSYIDHIKLTKKSIEELAQREKDYTAKNDQYWGFYGSPLEGEYGYDKTFGDLLGGNTFNELLAERKKQKGSVYGLDIMGTVEFPFADGQAAMTLTDQRTPAEKVADTKRNRLLIEGNILNYKPWEQARKFSELDRSRIPGYDLITCRPVLGWSRLLTITDPTNAFETTQRTLVQRTVNLLHPEGGEAFIQLKDSPTLNLVQWVEDLNQMSQIKVSSDVYGVYLRIKRTGEPEKVKLPIIKTK